MGRAFFHLFEAQQNVPSASAQLAESRNERCMVVSGLTGRQAPLGVITALPLHSYARKHRGMLGLVG
jgi:hypothetical protein